MKEITVDFLMKVEVTDDEYEELREIAKDPDPRAEGIYNEIFVPEWVENRARKTVQIVRGSGTISGSSWVKRPYEDL